MQTANSELGLHLHSRDKLDLAQLMLSPVTVHLLMLYLKILFVFYVFKGNVLVCSDYILC